VHREQVRRLLGGVWVIRLVAYRTNFFVRKGLARIVRDVRGLQIGKQLTVTCLVLERNVWRKKKVLGPMGGGSR